MPTSLYEFLFYLLRTRYSTLHCHIRLHPDSFAGNYRFYVKDKGPCQNNRCSFYNYSLIKVKL